MKPVLSAWPPKKRTVAFAPIAAGTWLVGFIVVALATQNFFLALLIPPFLAIGGAYALVGWPDLRSKDGKPFVEAQYKPYLFFVLAPLFALLLYPILGVASGQVGLPPAQWVTLLIIVLALAGGIAGAYFLVGVPNLVANARRQYEQVSPERRPFLFFPLLVVFFLILYLALGVATTRLLGRVVSGDPTSLLNIQVLVLVPVCLVLAGTLAWLLVGVPKPTRPPAEYMPKVTGRHRPRVFLGTFLLAGIPLTVAIGALLTYYSPLPEVATLPLAVVLGFAVSLGIAALSWGTPQRWRQYEDYTPGLPPRARLPFLLGLSVALGLAVAVGFGLADIDLFWGLLAGLFVAAFAAVLLTGTHRHIVARRGESTLVPDLPDGLKPLILFPTWFVIALVLFAVMTYALPGLVAVNALVAVVTGLAVAFLALEQPLLRDMLHERRLEKQKRKEWEARRKQRLAEAEQGAAEP